MTPPQTLSYLTLGARSMTALRAFYAALGWTERPGSSDEFATYEMGSILLALYPLGRLREEAAPGEDQPGSSWRGVTLGINVDSREAVDEAFEAAVGVGAKSVARPVEREWGGYSGYFADPDGFLWEVAWNPKFPHV